MRRHGPKAIIAGGVKFPHMRYCKVKPLFTIRSDLVHSRDFHGRQDTDLLFGKFFLPPKSYKRKIHTKNSYKTRFEMCPFFISKVKKTKTHVIKKFCV